jgi:hypothetical protein
MTVHDLIRQPPYERVWAVINSPEDMKLITQSTNTCSLAAVLLREESESVPEEGPVFLTDFESSYRRDVDLLRARLSGVLGRLEGRVVVIVAARSMHSVLYRHGEEEDPEKEIPGELHGFFEVQVALARAKTYEPKFAGLSPRRGLYKKTTKEWVTREISAIEGFNEVLETGIEDLAMRYGTRKEALHFIVQKARPYYQSIWDDCTDDERLVLAQLAQEGVANPKQAEAVHSLLNRGVLAKDPVLRVMNHSFAIFASQAFGADEVKRMEQSIGGIHWAHTRLILLGLLLALLLFLSTTQPAAVENLTRFLTGAVASLAAIITVANKLSGLRINVSES